MKQYYKIAIYGEPGVGKSTFAYGAPKPFFICTDGNYAFLPGAKEENHTVVSTWKQFVKAINKDYPNHETLVVDLLEDTYMFCEKDYCLENEISYVGDHEYGKGWRITKDNFFYEIARLIAKPKNIILIMHESSYDTKNKRGNTITKYRANYRIKDEVIDQIEGRVQFFLHCYGKDEEVNGQLMNVRYLSLIPKDNEFGIARGVDERITPTDIPLDWQAFEEAVRLNRAPSFESSTEVAESKTIETKTVEQSKETVATKEEPKKETISDIKEESKKVSKLEALRKAVGQQKETTNEVHKEQEPQYEAPKVEEQKPTVQEQPKAEEDNLSNYVKEETATPVEPKKVESKDDKLARIRAKLGGKQ